MAKNPEAASPLRRIWVALAGYVTLLIAFFYVARWFKVSAVLPHFPSAFVSFALLLLPYCLFGFGLAETLKARFSLRWARVLAPGLMVVPYLVYALPRGELRAIYVLAFVSLPIALAAWLEFSPAHDGLNWRDAVALAAVWVPIEFALFRGAWSHFGLSAMPKLLLMDAALYAFLVVRKLADVGYELRPRGRDLAVGLREWALFAPVAIGLGLALRFIHFGAYAPHPLPVAAGWTVVTFVFVALPEELFFRGWLQNLLEKRLAGNLPHSKTTGGSRPTRAQRNALLVTAVLFGLSHFNKPLPFNWRYVLLATIAGIFYGRAWRDRRRLLCSSITHATVDVVWSLWFR